MINDVIHMTQGEFLINYWWFYIILIVISVLLTLWIKS